MSSNEILADTSVWIQHLRSDDDLLIRLLEDEQILMHPMVIGELTCGNLRNRSALLRMLMEITPTEVVTYDEVLRFIERHQLMGRGIDYVDVHLLASVAMTNSAQLWTHDRRLREAAAELGIAYTP